MNLPQRFAKQYHDKTVAQLTTQLDDLARLITLNNLLSQYQGGEQLSNIKREIKEIEIRLFGVANLNKEDFWNIFNGLWGTAQNVFKENPDVRIAWLQMRNYIRNLEEQLGNSQDY